MSSSQTAITELLSHTCLSITAAYVAMTETIAQPATATDPSTEGAGC